MGLMVGDVAQELFFKARDVAFAGDFASGLIILAIGFYIMRWSNQLKTDNLPAESTFRREKRIP